MCQPEENAKVYLDTAKQLYKELVTVRKNKNTGTLRPCICRRHTQVEHKLQRLWLPKKKQKNDTTRDAHGPSRVRPSFLARCGAEVPCGQM
jgi:hypothetical protein